MKITHQRRFSIKVSKRNKQMKSSGPGAQQDPIQSGREDTLHRSALEGLEAAGEAITMPPKASGEAKTLLVLASICMELFQGLFLLLLETTDIVPATKASLHAEKWNG